jgi:hypothetical protein
VDLLERLLDRFGQRLHYVLGCNELRGDDFGMLERSGQLERALGLGAKVIRIRRLHDAVVQKINDYLLKVANWFRKDPQESLWTVARRATGVLVRLRRTTSWVMTRCACCRRLCRLRCRRGRL